MYSQSLEKWMHDWNKFLSFGWFASGGIEVIEYDSDYDFDMTTKFGQIEVTDEPDEGIWIE